MEDNMKDIYYKMKAWLVVKRLEKLEGEGAGDSVQDNIENEMQDIDENHNTLL
jgi:hypothetical protein